MSTPNRKARLLRNMGETSGAADARFGAAFYPTAPAESQIRTSIVLPERLFLGILRTEVERLSKDVAELRRFFGHFFDPTVGAEERETYVRAFQGTPPVVTLGYPRITMELPIVAIVNTSDEEDEEGFLYNLVSETRPGEEVAEDQEYQGAFWTQVFSVYVLANHPDVTLYLYHFVKLSLFAAKDVLMRSGLMELHYGGGELSPEETYMPENAFGRVLTVRCKTMQTVPKVLEHVDSRRLRIAGIFRDDVVVDGLRGGVKADGVCDGDEE